MKEKMRVLVKDDGDVWVGETRVFGGGTNGITLFRCTTKQDLGTPGRYFIKDERGNLVAIARGIEEVHEVL